MIGLMLTALAMQAGDPCYVGDPAAAPAHCPRWQPVQLVRAVTDASGYVDPASVSREGNQVDVNTLTVLTAPIANDVHRFVVRVRLFCADRTTMVLHLTGYNAAGAKVHDAAEPPATPSPAPPGSPRAVLFDQFCAR